MAPASTLGGLLRAKAAASPEHRIFTFLGHDLEPAGEHTYGDASTPARVRSPATLERPRGRARPPRLPAGPRVHRGALRLPVRGPDRRPLPAARSGPQVRGATDADDRRRRDAARSSSAPRALQASIAEVLGADHPAARRQRYGVGRLSSPSPRDPGDVAVLQYTSGSTNVPRGVMVSHANVLDNCEFIAEGMDLDAEGGGLMWLPPYHDMGLIGGMFSPMHSGRPMTLMSPIAFLVDPLNWLRAITKYRANASGGPNFAFDLCVRRSTEADRDGLDLSSWTTAYNGAESVRPETMEAFTAAFAPHGFDGAAFYPCYGLAEATLMVSGGDKSTGPYVARGRRRRRSSRAASSPRGEARSIRLTSCGVPRPGARVAIVDPETREPCPEDDDRRDLDHRAERRRCGYWDRDVETESVFGARTAERRGPVPAQRRPRVPPRRRALHHRAHHGGAGARRSRALPDRRRGRRRGAASPALRHNCAAAFLIETGGRQRAALVAEVRARAEDLDAVYAAIRERRARPARHRAGRDLPDRAAHDPAHDQRQDQAQRVPRALPARPAGPVGEWLDLG